MVAIKETRILVVEDERITSRAIQGHLTNRGYIIADTACSGEEAVRKAGDLRPDIVLMDVTLEGEMDGVSAAMEIRTHYNLPVIYITAQLDDSTWERVKMTEPYGHVLKPIDENVLFAAIEMALYRHSLDRKLKRSEERYRRITDNMLDMVSLVDADGMFLYVSPTHTTILGYNLEDLYGGLIFDFIHPGDRDRVTGLFAESLEKHTTARMDYRFRHARGNFLWLETLGNLMFDEDGKVLAAIFGSRDITERKEMEEALKISEERFRMVVESQTELICRFVDGGVITFVNGAYCRYYSRTKEDLIGHNFIPFILEEDKSAYQAALLSIGKDAPIASVEYRILMPGGEVRWQQWTIRGIFDDAWNVIEYQAVGRDTTDSKYMENRLKHMSMHDSLTGLYNRAYFDEEMKRVENKRFLPVSIVICDINGLKVVNDTLGHQRGDDLIRAAGEILRSCFRESDVVARIGGDEFAVLLPNTAGDVVLKSCDRIRKSIEQNRSLHCRLPLSMALGFAVRNNFSQRLETIFTEADDRMYTEKENTRESTRKMILDALVEELNTVDPFRVEHMMRVGRLSVQLGTAYGLNETSLEILKLAAEYHDIGMIGISASIIGKGTALAPSEFSEIKRHVEMGSRIASGHPLLREAADIILKHHEWWNGKGYPLGLKMGDIPLASRIIAIAEAYDYMKYHDNSKQKMAHKDALGEILNNAGTQFDPQLADLFAAISPE